MITSVRLKATWRLGRRMMDGTWLLLLLLLLGVRRDVGRGRHRRALEARGSRLAGSLALHARSFDRAFTIQQFAEMYAGKLGCKAGPLCKALWGDYAYSAKTKRIVAIKRGDGTGSSLSKGNSSSSSQPLFVSWILEPIWKAYGCLDGGHQSVLAGLCDKLKLGEAVRKAVHHADARVALRALMTVREEGAWPVPDKVQR